MLKKEAAANELATQMKLNMRIRVPTQEEKFAAVLNHLNSAAEAFDEAGDSKFAELVTQMMTNFADQLHPRE